eukprot:5221367-Prymnesium_polylepis.1
MSRGRVRRGRALRGRRIWVPSGGARPVLAASVVGLSISLASPHAIWSSRRHASGGMGGTRCV